RATLARLRRHRELRTRRGPQVVTTAWELEWTPQLRAYEQQAHRWYRFLSRDFRRARAALVKYLTPESPGDSLGQRDLLGDLVEAGGLTTALAEAGPTMSRLFGIQWQGMDSDPDVLESLLDWVLRLHADVDRAVVPAGLLDFFVGRAEDRDLLRKVEEAE